MKLKTISFQNLKGATATIDLASLTLFVGNNATGKSTRTDAVRLLLLGHLPELGKTNKATFGLCSGAELIVAGVFDDGRKISRRWYLKGDAVKLDEDLPVEFLPGAKELELFDVMLDADIYFALSEKERINYVFSHIPGAEEQFGVDRIEEEIGRELYGTEGLKGETVDFVLGTFGVKKLDASKAPNFTGWTSQNFLDFAGGAMKEIAATAKLKGGIMEKTAQGLAFLRTQDAPDQELAQLNLDHSRIAAELEVLRNEKATRTAQAEQVNANRRRRDELLRGVALKSSTLVARDAAEKKLSELEAELGSLGQIADASVLDLANEERSAQVGFADLQRQSVEVGRSIQRLNAEIETLKHQTSCPTCGTVGTAWRDSKLNESESAVKGLIVKNRQLDEQIEKVGAHHANLETRLRDLKTKQTKRRQTEEFARDVKRTLDHQRSQLELISQREKDLATLPEAEALGSDLAEIVRKVSEKTDQLRRIEEARRANTSRTNELKRLAQAEEGQATAKLEQQAAKAGEGIVQQIKASLVQKAFLPLLEAANAFFARAELLFPLNYHDGEIGRWDSGRWIAHATFSGTEKALTYAAIQAALAGRSPLRLMLIDELGRLDDTNALALFRAVAQAVEDGRIDQFIGIDTGRGLLYSAESELTVGTDFSLQAIASPEILA